MMSALAIWLFLIPAGSAQEPGVVGAPLAQEQDLREQLDAAKQQYFAGGHADALTALDAFIAAAPQSGATDLIIEAWVYRGEIQYVTGDRAGSWSSFLQVLDLDPDYRISTFLHPAEVVDWFDLVSRDVATVREQPEEPVAPPAPAPPVWTLAPVGVPQLGQGRRGAGLALGVAQVTTAGASVGLHLGLRQWKRDLAEQGVERGDPRLRTPTAVQWGVQVPVTGAFYALYISSVVSGRRLWKRSHTGPRTVTVWADPSDHTVGVAGRW